jgi:hypothetical protein
VPVLDIAASQALVVKIIGDLFAKRHAPVPGALVKAQAVSEANSKGDEFNERELGFRNFLELIRATPGIGLQTRAGSDVLLAPLTAGDILTAYARPLPRLRRDFWRAFIEFPVLGTIRLYDSDDDKIYYETLPTARPGVPIEPVSREEQLTWRKSFAEEQAADVKDALMASLQGIGTSVFNEFARRLRENPSVMHAWNRYAQKKITDYVAAWAAANDVPEERWCSGLAGVDGRSAKGTTHSKEPNVGQRAELYNFLDALPIEDLLQLRVPLDWVLKVTRNRK